MLSERPDEVVSRNWWVISQEAIHQLYHTAKTWTEPTSFSEYGTRKAGFANTTSSIIIISKRHNLSTLLYIIKVYRTASK